MDLARILAVFAFVVSGAVIIACALSRAIPLWMFFVGAADIMVGGAAWYILKPDPKP